MSLDGKNILITGAGKRIGHSLAITCAKAGANVIVHYKDSRLEAQDTCDEIISMGRRAIALQADLEDPDAAAALVDRACVLGPLFALVNNAAIYQNVNWETAARQDWERHLQINLIAPFMLSQAFAKTVDPSGKGRIVNLLDWRWQRPGADHLPYMISKSGLAALTYAMAAALAPSITVNGLALGAVLPPVNAPAPPDLLSQIPSHRWASLDEVGRALLFMLDGPEYITGEILYVDGGRHLL